MIVPEKFQEKLDLMSKIKIIIVQTLRYVSSNINSQV